MLTGAQTTADINADFALAIINRAAHIVASSTPQDGENSNAYEALAKAGDEFLAGKKNKRRTYGWTLLVHDLREFLEEQGIIEKGTWASIGTWSTATEPKKVARTLLEAAPIVSQLARERTESASMFELMKPEHQQEHILMGKAASFLTSQGLKVAIEWHRENPDNDPIDFGGTIDDVPWAFELKRLRSDPEGSKRKVGHRKERKSLKEQLAELAKPIPKEPDSPEELQKAIDKAITDASKTSKLDAANGANYCLVIHNQQFLYVPSWEHVSSPDLSAFDAVLILHQDDLTAAKAWEVPKQSGLNTVLPSQDINDLADMSEFMLSTRPKIDAEAIRSAWEQIESLNLTDEDFAQAIAQARGPKDAANPSGAGHQRGADAQHQSE